ILFFFFQAEDGIRDGHVTGVQTCALPISSVKFLEEAAPILEEFHARVAHTGFEQWFPSAADGTSAPPAWKQNMIVLLLLYPVVRSEERRVGKECRAGVGLCGV